MTEQNLLALDLVYKVMIMPESWMRPKCDGDVDWEPFEKYDGKIYHRWYVEVGRYAYETCDKEL